MASARHYGLVPKIPKRARNEGVELQPDTLLYPATDSPSRSQRGAPDRESESRRAPRRNPEAGDGHERAHDAVGA